MSKFKVIASAFVAQHHAIESIVVFEFREKFEPKPVAIELNNGREMIRCPGDAKMRATDN